MAFIVSRVPAPVTIMYMCATAIQVGLATFERNANIGHTSDQNQKKDKGTQAQRTYGVW